MVGEHLIIGLRGPVAPNPGGHPIFYVIEYVMVDIDGNPIQRSEIVARFLTPERAVEIAKIKAKRQALNIMRLNESMNQYELVE